MTVYMPVVILLLGASVSRECIVLVLHVMSLLYAWCILKQSRMYQSDNHLKCISVFSFHICMTVIVNSFCHIALCQSEVFRFGNKFSDMV